MESDQYEQGGGGGGGGDDQGDAQAKQVINLRSYECNFCKRGFSNAQALGGHMNIHRKDKAKLKQQSSNMEANSSDVQEVNKLVLLPNLNSSIVLSQSQQQDQQHHAAPSRDINEALMTQLRQQLPLFSESPTKSEMQKPQSSQGETQRETTTTTTTIAITEEALLLSGQDSSMELDLELRLGPEPHDPSSAPTGTRKFF